MDKKARYAFRKALEAIKADQGRGTELISLYIPPTKQIYDAAGYLRNEHGQSSNIKSKSTRKNVTAAIESILSRLKAYKKTPENGLVFFVGHAARGNNNTAMVTHIVEPPQAITTFLYRCDNRFHTELLEAIMAVEKTYGLLVIDRKEATIGLLTGATLKVVKRYDSHVPRKHHKGGQSALRFERLIEIAAHEFYVKVGETCSEAFLAVDDLAGVLVGGPGATKDYFLKKGFFHHEVAKKVLDAIDVGYTDEYGLRELVENAQETLSDLEVVKEKRLIQRLLAEIRKDDGGLSAYGEVQVRQALAVGAVELILLSEGVAGKWWYGSCGACGQQANGDLDPVASEAGAPTICPNCQAAWETTVRSRLEELEEAAEAIGAEVELISTESEEGVMFLKAFRGLAAILRFGI